MRRIGLATALLLATVLTGCGVGPFSTQAVSLPAPAAVTPSDTLWSAQSWFYQLIGADSAWSLLLDPLASSSAVPAIVAVIDTGVTSGHPDLERVLTADGMIFLGATVAPLGAGLSPTSLLTSHGTHVIGLVAAQGGAGGAIGVGYNATRELPVRVMPVMTLLPDPAGGSLSDLLIGIAYAGGFLLGLSPIQPADVINMSLGASALGEADAEFFQLVIDAAAARDIVLVAAAGNGGTLNGVDYPARFASVIAVGSVDRPASDGADPARSSFSDHGDFLELVAPGAERSGSSLTGLVSTAPSGGYARQAGTSMASPLVAGTAALVRALNPSLSAAEVRVILRATATDLGASGWDPQYGCGLLNVSAAVRAALTSPYGSFAGGAGAAAAACEVTAESAASGVAATSPSASPVASPREAPSSFAAASPAAATAVTGAPSGDAPARLIVRLGLGGDEAIAAREDIETVALMSLTDGRFLGVVAVPAGATVGEVEASLATLAEAELIIADRAIAGPRTGVARVR